MTKRILPLVLAVALVVCLFAISVSAETIQVAGNTVIDYLDYVSGYDLYIPDDGWAFVRVDPALQTTMVDDSAGHRQYTNGQREFTMSCSADAGSVMSCSSYYPGGAVNKSYLKLENIPDGSKFWMQWICDVFEDGQQVELNTRLRAGIIYYDENFSVLSYDYDDTYITIDAVDERTNRIIEKTITKPENATYCNFYTAVTFEVGRSNERDTVTLRCQFEQPSLKVSTSYTQVIIDAIIASKKPVGSDGIVDAGELEDYLQDSVSDGREEADIVLDQAPDLITLHASGFLFIASVIDILWSAGWLNGILIVSLSLGIFGFLVNAGSSLGRSLEHRGKGGGKF